VTDLVNTAKIYAELLLTLPEQEAV
jgi:hypothetical protein